MMKSILGPTLALLICCAGILKESQAAQEDDNYFAGRNGCFLLYNIKTKAFVKIIGEENCRKQFPACSTFKVPLAVMAFDSGVLKNENQILKWDGVKGFLEQHDRDHNAKTWMRDSVVWFSQRITPHLGKKRFQKYLNSFDYGNKDLSAGITEAWLVSPAENKPALKISAYQQVEFMKSLWTDSLPVSKRATRLTREITFLETSPHGFKLSGKTGSNFYDKEHKIHFGWFVSHLEKGEEEYIAVANLSDLAPSDESGYGGAKAKMIAKKILTKQGLW